MTDPNVAPPLFTSADLSVNTQAAVASRGNPATLNLDDIFGDVAFTPDGDTVFLSEQKEEDLLNSGEGANVANYASRPDAAGHFSAVPQGGGLYTTQLGETGKPSLAMGSAGGGVKSSKAVPFRHTPQASHHLQYAHKKKKSSGRSDRKMSEQQKVERR